MKSFFYKLATDEVNGFGPGCVKILLKLLSFIYAGLIRLRELFYKLNILPSVKLDVPVVSVGNLTMGGAGKTPVVEWLARKLRQRDKKAVILTRGYMPDHKKANSSDSDEARMLQENLIDVPVLVGSDRCGNAKDYLKKDSVDVFLLDDGFQHFKLRRDLDVVLVDCANPWGNGSLLPRGILREPASALKRADVFIISKADQHPHNVSVIQERLEKINPAALRLEARHQPVGLIDLLERKSYPYDRFKDQPICTLCSIGSPASFARTMEQCGYAAKKNFEFMDHYAYQSKDIESMISYCREQGVKVIITTQKDAVKLRPYSDLFGNVVKVFALQITIAFKDNEDVFLERIFNLS